MSVQTTGVNPQCWCWLSVLKIHETEFLVCVSFVSFWLLFPFPGKTQDSELQTHLLPDGSQLSMKMASLSQRGGTGVDCTIMSCSLWYDYATDYNDDATDDDGVDDDGICSSVVHVHPSCFSLFSAFRWEWCPTVSWAPLTIALRVTMSYHTWRRSSVSGITMTWLSRLTRPAYAPSAVAWTVTPAVNSPIPVSLYRFVTYTFSCSLWLLFFPQSVCVHLSLSLPLSHICMCFHLLSLGP